MRFLESLTNADYSLATTEANRQFIARCLEKQSYPPVPLLIETQGRRFENMESILFQAARNNGLQGTAALRKALSIPPGRSLNPKRHAQLSTTLLMNGRSISSSVPTVSSTRGPLTVELGGHALRYDQLALSKNRICPMCVAESGYGRSYWSIAPYAACELHGVALIDKCDECNAPVSPSRPDFASCGCGTSFADTKVVSVSAGARRIAQLLGTRFRFEKVVADHSALGFPNTEMNSLSLNSLIDLVIFLGALEPNAKVVRMRKLKGPVTLRVAVPRLERAAKALSNWPMGFYAQLRYARSFIPRSESLDHVIRSLDHVMSLGILSLHQAEYKFISAELGNFFAKPHEWNEARKHAHETGIAR